MDGINDKAKRIVDMLAAYEHEGINLPPYKRELIRELEGDDSGRYILATAEDVLRLFSKAGYEVEVEVSYGSVFRCAVISSDDKNFRIWFDYNTLEDVREWITRIDAEGWARHKKKNVDEMTTPDLAQEVARLLRMS